MGVTVHDERYRKPTERLLQTARAEKRVDFERLAFHSPLNRRIMQQRDQVARPKSCERRLQLQRFIDGFPHKLFDDRFSPRAERTLPETTAKSLDPGDADAVRFVRIAVENDDPSVRDDVPHLVTFS